MDLFLFSVLTLFSTFLTHQKNIGQLLVFQMTSFSLDDTTLIGIPKPRRGAKTRPKIVASVRLQMMGETTVGFPVGEIMWFCRFFGFWLFKNNQKNQKSLCKMKTYLLYILYCIQSKGKNCNMNEQDNTLTISDRRMVKFSNTKSGHNHQFCTSFGKFYQST